MDILIPAALALCLTNAVFAALWLKQRRTIAGLNQSLAHLLSHQHARIQEAYNNGFTAGLKRGLGDMYKAIRKAERDGRDVVEAAASVGRMHELV